VLVDIMMPDMDGYETMREIRAMPEFVDLPVVAVTAKAMKGDRQKCIQAGASDYVSKPVDIDHLVSVLRVGIQRATGPRRCARPARTWSCCRRRAEVAAEGDALAIPAPPFTDGGARPDAPKAKVLIVDDDERNAYAAVHALEELGHELVVARSGEEALRRVLTDDFAVILLDLHMPGMDGYETAALIRSRKRSRNTPIVFVTAVFRDEPHLFQAYASGAVDVVFKPADPFILRAKVQVLVSLHLKTMEARREAEHRQRLLEENARVRLEKLRAERQLAQAQKMEAVGQLTGGVAHDFNNLLTVVLGNVDLLSRKLDADPRTQRQLGAIRHAADRGRSLTRQLLAFSRRQHLSPVTLDVNVLVQNFLPLMQQAVGESVTLRADMPEQRLCVHADAAQLETALLNLAVNARDAMPEGGELVISATRLPADQAPQKQELDPTPTGSASTWSTAAPAWRRTCSSGCFEPSSPPRRWGRALRPGLRSYGYRRHIAPPPRPGFRSILRRVGSARHRFPLYLTRSRSRRRAAAGRASSPPAAAVRGRFWSHAPPLRLRPGRPPVLALTVRAVTASARSPPPAPPP
jgi:CheY-like chemotaxis protein